MAELDLEIIRHALAAARLGGFSEVELELESSSFSGTLSKQKVTKAEPKPSLNGQVTEEVPHSAIKAITAGCVGYYKPAESILQVGSRVSQGDIVATITALGLANDVEAPVSGEIVEVLASPDQPVEYGQPLAMVKEG